MRYSLAAPSFILAPWHRVHGRGVMEKGRADTEGGSALFVRPTVLDAGIGVLYFFTSHMVIRAMYSIGVDRTSTELSVFFLVVIASVIAAHLLSRPLLRARRFAESALGIPAVSVTAALGATLALGGGRGAVLRVGRLAGACLRVDHRHLDVDHPRFAARERLVLPRSGARGGRRVLFSVPLRQLVLGHDRAGVPARAAAGDHRVHHPRRQARRRGRCARAGRGDAGAASAGGGCSGVRHRLQRDRVLGGARERRAVVGA